MSRFAIAPSSQWVLASGLQSERRAWLLRGASFERSVIELLASCSRLSLHRQRAKGGPGARCVVNLQVCSARLDRFFSSSCGYRAQYLVAPSEAHLADLYVIESVLRLALANLALRPHRFVDSAFLEASLSHPWAKVWPHQGLWVRQARHCDRVLLVPQWQHQLRITNLSRRRKLAIWGSLAPSGEQVLQVKGGFVRTGENLCLGKSQSERAKELHELGFT